MSLYTRLTGIDRAENEPKLAIHSLFALLSERKRGRLTNQQVLDSLGLSALEKTELIMLVGKIIDSTLDAGEVEDVLLLAEQGVPPYDTEAAVKSRLGV